MAHDTAHHFVYKCEGVGRHPEVLAALRATGADLIEAGPESHYASSIRNRQRWDDAAQFERIKIEISRLRCSIVDAIAAGSVDGLAEALKVAPRFDFDWEARSDRMVA